MRHLFYKLSAIIIPIGLVIFFTNFFVDPANIITRKTYVSGIASILSKGHNVDNVSNYDHRLMQEQMVSKLVHTPDIIVLGSSRIMEVGNDFFPGKKVLNCGVSHANMYDLIALSGLLDSLGHLPAEIYINVEPGLIDEAGTSEWQSIAPYYDYFLRKYLHSGSSISENNTALMSRKLYSLVSFEYFKESIKFMLNGGSKKYYDVGMHRPVVWGRFSDGTVCYSDRYKRPDTVDKALEAWTIGSRDGLSKPDAIKIKLFKCLLDFLNQKKVKVTFIMLPYHPALFKSVNSYQKFTFPTYDSIFRNIAYQRKIQLIGTFDPKVSGVHQVDFYDAYHCSKEVIKKLF